MRFYESINKYQLKLAPSPLSIDDKIVFTNDEKIYNEQNYYRIEYSDYPQDGLSYRPYFELVDNYYLQKWEIVNEVEENAQL